MGLGPGRFLAGGSATGIADGPCIVAFVVGPLESIPSPGHLSWWLEDVAGDAADAPPLAGDSQTDVAIIGGGYVGPWSAIELKLREPSIDHGLTGLPIIGHSTPGGNIVHALGWSGNGVGPSRLGGKFVASLIQERDDAWARSPLVDLEHDNFPPDPVRYLGSKIVRAAVARKEQAELGGREPGRAVSALAAQVPSGLIPKE